MKRMYVVLIAAVLFFSVLPAGFAQVSYPAKPIKALVGFAPGGPTDLIARGILPILQERLGQPIAITNMPGAAGGVAASAVLAAPKDGYTVLYGTETMSLWQVMDILNVSPTSDFIPVKLTNQAIPVLAVPPDSRFSTMEEFVRFARANPEKIRIGTAGPGTVPHVSGLMLTQALGARFTFVPFAGGRPAVIAVMGGQVDATIEMIQTMVESYRAKQLKILASFTNEPIRGLEEIPAAGRIFPEMAKFLPYGPYFGLFVPRGTPAEVVRVLETKMDEAMRDPRWPEYQARIFLSPINLSGKAAVDFIDTWTARATWILFDGGGAKKSPLDFGIKKPAILN